MTRRFISAALAAAGTAAVLGASAQPALASNDVLAWDGGVACRTGGPNGWKIPGCTPVISNARKVTSSWTRHSLVCPIDRPYIRVGKHFSLGNGWDFLYDRNAEPDTDIVDARAGAPGRPGMVTISVDRSSPSPDDLLDEQLYRWAIGCSSVAP